MKQLHSINYYMHLLSEGCENCSAYNEIGGCGTWASHCHVREEKEEAENFMEDSHLTFEDFIALMSIGSVLNLLNMGIMSLLPDWRKRTEC